MSAYGRPHIHLCGPDTQGNYTLRVLVPLQNEYTSISSTNTLAGHTRTISLHFQNQGNTSVNHYIHDLNFIKTTDEDEITIYTAINSADQGKITVRFDKADPTNLTDDKPCAYITRHNQQGPYAIHVVVPNDLNAKKSIDQNFSTNIWAFDAKLDTNGTPPDDNPFIFHGDSPNDADEYPNPGDNWDNDDIKWLEVEADIDNSKKGKTTIKQGDNDDKGGLSDIWDDKS